MAETDFFPMRFIPPIVEALKRGIPSHEVVERSLGPSEGNDIIGVFPAQWVPELDTKEMGSTEPTMSRYTVRIQNLRIDADEIVGRRLFNNTSRMIRAILYRDAALRLALLGLQEVISQSTERVKIFDVTKQDYLSARNSDQQMMYLCTTEMVFVTETSLGG
jgi:hypothetical protein